jgi:threonine 3-dehydrogenase
MLALRKTAPQYGGISLDEIAIPQAGAGEVCIEVAFAGICGTDLHLYHWAPAFQFATLPVVMGHEISGRVVAIGGGVTRVAVNDRVAVESHIPCHHCYACLNGVPQVCQNTRYPGIHINGGFARYVILPEFIVWRLDEAIPADIGTLMEPFGIAVHASTTGTGVAGQNVVIAGCGPIGLMNVAAARALGANRIIATDINPQRLKVAEQLGADVLIDPSAAAAALEIKRVTGGVGPDVFIEYSGAPESFALADEVLAPGGELRLLAIPPRGTAPDFAKWVLRGLSVQGLHGRRLFSTWLQATRLLVDRKVNLRPVISDVLPLQRAVAGFEKAAAGKTLKVLIEPA